jgi:hypothetical protein
MIELIGFTPDLPATTPGAIPACDSLIPSSYGMQGAPSQVDAVTGLSALTAQCRGSMVLSNTAGTKRFFAGTQTKLYELSSGAWSDVSRGSSYAGASETRWAFEQFGNVALASNNVEKIQWSTTGAFADITAGPIARIVFATDNFVFGLDCNHTAVGDNPDGWMCSAYQDYSSWTASVTTQATNGRLIGNGGPLTAGQALGPYAVAYKADAIFLGSYVGPPVVWQWERIPGEVGCIGPDALCDIGGAHVFVGRYDIWIFNGTQPVSIGEGVREWFFRSINQTAWEITTVRYEPKSGNVWIWYPSGSSTVLNACLVYSTKRKKWGVANMTIEAAVYFATPGATYDTLDDYGATYDTLPDVPWDSSYWNSGSESLCVFNTSHQLKALTGTSSGGTFTTNDFGDDTRYSMLRKSKVRFNLAPTSATAQAMSKTEAGVDGSPGSISTYSGGKFDHRQSGRFHSVTYTMTGPFVAQAVDVELVPQGER